MCDIFDLILIYHIISTDFGFGGSYQSAGYAAAAYSNLNQTVDDHIRHIFLFSKVCLAVSGFFWSWAVVNTIKMKSGFDGGVISFFLSGASSFYLFRRTRNGAEGFQSPGLIGRGWILASHLTVALNYALGAFLALTLGTRIYVKFAVYCVIFFLCWLSTALLGWNLVTQVLDYGVEDQIEDITTALDF